MCHSNCCLLTRIQISKEAGDVVWYSHLFENLPQFVVIHTVKGFGIVNKAEVYVFLALSCFFCDPTDVGSLISGSSAFAKSSLNIWKFLVHVLLKPGLENFEHYFAVMWDKCGCTVVWVFFALPFFGIGVKTDLFQSRAHCWVFQICRHVECITLTASSFKIWNSSAGIPSLPLALFVVMLPKAHLTSDSRMSDSRWVITPSWLSGLWSSFLYSSSLYSCHSYYLLLLSGPHHFCPLLSPSLHEMFPLSLIFLKKSLVFSILLFSPWKRNAKSQNGCLRRPYK